MLTLEIMNAMWPRGNATISRLVEGIVSAAPSVFANYGLNSGLVIAHAMAQFSHECGAGTEMKENINYTPERACQVGRRASTARRTALPKLDHSQPIRISIPN